MSDLAARLADAIRTRTALDPQQSGLTVDEAYDVQDELIAALGGETEAVKLGLTSRAKQEQMGVAEPAYGWLLAGSRLDADRALVAGELIQPRVEPEIAFRTGSVLEGTDVSPEDVLAATEGVMPAIDILDSRYAGYKFTLPDVIADNTSAARYAIGDPVSPAGIDLRTVGCVFTHNGKLAATAAGAAVLGHPADAVAWLVRKLAGRGRSLPAGSVVLAGSVTAAVAVEPGDNVTVEIDQLGKLSLAVE